MQGATDICSRVSSIIIQLIIRSSIGMGASENQLKKDALEPMSIFIHYIIFLFPFTEKLLERGDHPVGCLSSPLPFS